MNDFKFVEVKWLDSTSHCSDGWSEIKDIPEVSKITTRGWLVKESEDSVSLAGSHYDDDGTSMVGEYITIPRCSFLGKPRTLKN